MDCISIMKFIYVTEWEIGIGTQAEIPDDAYVIGPYSKQRMLETIREFDNLAHPMPIYTFQAPNGALHETLDIRSFANLHGLNSDQLIALQYKFDWRNHKGWKFIHK